MVTSMGRLMQTLSQRLAWAGFGALGGLAVAFVSLLILKSDGPMLPLLVLISPVGMIVEATPMSPAVFQMVTVVGGVLVYAVYGFAAGVPPRSRNALLVAAVHLICLAVAVMFKRGLLQGM